MSRTLATILLIGLQLAAPASAMDDPVPGLTVDEILELHRGFVGIEELWSGIRGQRLAGPIELGEMTGVYSIEMLYGEPLPTPDDGVVTAGAFLESLRYHLANELPMLNQETFLTPEGDYSRGPNGELRELAGEELESAYTDAVFESFLYCYPSDDVYAVDYVGRETIDGAPCHVLEYRPHYSAILPFMPRRVYIAIDDGAMIGHRTAYEIMTVEVIADGFSEIEGLRLPFGHRLDMGEHAPPALQRLEDFELNPDLDPADFQPEQSAGIAFSADREYVELPFEELAGLLFLEARVDGEPCRMVLDSGAGMTVLDSDFAARLGLEEVGELPAGGAGGVGTIAVIGADSLELGGMLLEEPTMIAMDLSGFARALGGQWDGILGYEVFARLPVTVDYTAGLIRLHDPETFKAPLPQPGRVEVLPLSFESNLPVVQAALEDHDPGPFLLDLGNSNYTTVHAPAVERLGLQESHPDGYEIVSGGFGGMNEHLLVRLESLTLGSFVLPDSPVVLAVGGGGVMESERLLGNIGQAELSRFSSVTLDYIGKRLILEAPEGGPGGPAPVNNYGLGIDWLGEEPAVAFTWKDSPAFRAGLREGDLLLEFDGEPVENWNHGRATERLEAAPGTPLELTVERDGEELTVEMTARELL